MDLRADRSPGMLRSFRSNQVGKVAADAQDLPPASTFRVVQRTVIASQVRFKAVVP